MKKPKKIGIYLCTYPDGKQTLEVINYDPGFPRRDKELRVVTPEEEGDGEPLHHPCFNGCKWEGPLTPKDVKKSS